MKKGVRTTGLTIAFAIIAVLGLMAYIRLAPSDPATWHVAPVSIVPETAGWKNWVLYPPKATDGPVAMPGGAYAIVVVGGTVAPEVLRKLDDIARKTPRTSLLAGTPDQGHMTWVTRSMVFGFPDYTTAQAVQDGLMVRLSIVARQRFGDGDMGVNAARLKDWLSRL